MARSNSKISLAHEVIDSSQKAVSVAQGHSSTSRYKYKAKALLVGLSSLRPYDPIYLKGLRDGMSGVWVVTSVTHIFNSGLKYTMRVHLGSNDYLLKIRPKDSSGDISIHSSNIYPKIPNEYESFHSQQNQELQKYRVTKVKVNKLPLETGVAPSWTQNKLKSYTYNSISQTTGELHTNPYELRPPTFSNVHQKIVWNDR